MRKKLWMALAAVLMLAVPASALAAATVVITPSFKPNKRAKGTHVHFKLVGTDPANSGVPAPTDTTVVHLPKGLVLNTKAFPTCTQNALLSEAQGSPGSACTRKSIVGSGHAQGGVLAPATATTAAMTILENLTVVAANGAPQGGNPVLLLHVQSVPGAPLAINIVIPGVLSKDSGPYSYKFSFTVPTIATIPGLPNGSILEFDVNIGATTKAKGKTVNLITEAKKCTKGGFSWGADFTFTDGEHFNTTAKSPC
jgi:hypothetical protein